MYEPNRNSDFIEKSFRLPKALACVEKLVFVVGAGFSLRGILKNQKSLRKLKLAATRKNRFFSPTGPLGFRLFLLTQERKFS
jgi:hypothetical protein